MGWQDFKLVFLSYLYDLIKYAKSQKSSKLLKIRWSDIYVKTLYKSYVNVNSMYSEDR